MNSPSRYASASCPDPEQSTNVNVYSTAATEAHELITNDELADALEEMARQHCHTSLVPMEYKGVVERLITDSGACSANADALRLLASIGRFRVVREYGRMVVGYWKENDPITPPTPSESRPPSS